MANPLVWKGAKAALSIGALITTYDTNHCDWNALFDIGAAVVLGSLAVAGVAVATKECVEMKQENKRLQSVNEELDSQIDRLTEHVSQDALCVICYRQVKDAVIHPCGHTQSCQPCARRVLTCPLCRTVITRVMPQ